MLKKIRLVNGLSIAYQRWNDGLNNPKVLCVHGWLDNSNSFAYLGPKLASKGYDVVAIDLMGHGKKRF
jgi:pimeloyl-ACP methyl ester carboxylesterase